MVYTVVVGGFVSMERVYLFLYFFSYSAAIGCLSVCVISKATRGVHTLSRYSIWIAASLAFLLFRNVVYYLKVFRGMADIESTFAFYALYMLTMSAFLGTLSWAALGYAFSGRATVVRRATVAAVVIPLAFIPALALWELGESDRMLRLHLVNAVMYFSYFATIAILVALAVRLPKIPDPFDRSLCKANVVSGSSYVILAFLQWYFVYRGELYDIYPFCIVNIVLFLMFFSSAFVIGREYLARKDEPRVNAVPAPGRFDLAGGIPSYPGCNEEESLIVSLISRGATNREIAEILGSNVSRVKNIVYRIFSRFDVRSRTELVCFFGENAPLSPEADLLERSVVEINPRVPLGS